VKVHYSISPICGMFSSLYYGQLEYIHHNIVRLCYLFGMCYTTKLQKSHHKKYNLGQKLVVALYWTYCYLVAIDEAMRVDLKETYLKVLFFVALMTTLVVIWMNFVIVKGAMTLMGKEICFVMVNVFVLMVNDLEKMGLVASDLVAMANAFESVLMNVE
jgi:hypothetical protein